ncbi:MAG: glycosyl transferase [Planctomycetota bacterium]|nr:MAG: glycosyl transferase [Planctomycetota bacterium]
MSEQLGLSVVIVNWNTRGLLLDVLGRLARCRESSSRRMQVIVVDNASEDGSAAAVAEEFEDVLLLAQDRNLGFAGGVNLGFEAAQEELIVLLNTDVSFEPEALEALAHHVEQEPRLGVCGPRVSFADGSFQSSYWRFPSLWQLFCTSCYLYKLFPRTRLFDGERYGGQVFSEPHEVDAVSGCVFLLRRSLIDRIGGLDEGYFMYFEETDLCRRARAAGVSVGYFPGASFVHFGGVSARLARRRNFLQFRRSRVRFFRKHHGVWAAACARVLNALFLLLRLPAWIIRSLLPGSWGKEARARVSLYASGIVDAFASSCR